MENIRRKHVFKPITHIKHPIIHRRGGGGKGGREEEGEGGGGWVAKISLFYFSHHFIFPGRRGGEGGREGGRAPFSGNFMSFFCRQGVLRNLLHVVLSRERLPDHIDLVEQ